MARAFSMDDFTPPPPSQLPPPLPPPARDYSPSDFYRSMTSHTNASSAAAVAPSVTTSESETTESTRTRRPSFSFLNRTKSHQVPTTRSASGATMLRKQKLRAQEEQLRQRQERERAAIPKSPPQLPSHNPLPVINTFGGEDARPDSFAIVANKAGNFSRPSIHMSSSLSGSSPGRHGVPMPPVPGSGSSPAVGGIGKNGEYVEPQTRTESMTNRGRYSYASSAVGNVNSPRRVRRRKDPTPFNILVVGAKNSGKTSFIEFLRTSLALPASKHPAASPLPGITARQDGSAFTSHFLETEIEGERVGLTLWDSQGLEKNVVDLQLREMVAFIESKFEDTFAEEQKVMRSPGAKDTHIHCVFLVLDPLRLDVTVAASRNKQQDVNHSLPTLSKGIAGLDDELDLSVMKALSGKTTVIPVISKADTLTQAHMAFLKRSVWSSIQASKLDPLEALGLEEDSEEEEYSPDSDDYEDADSSLPIQKNGSSDAIHTTSLKERDETDIIDNLVDRSSSSASARTASSTTTPSPVMSKPKHSHSHSRSFSQLSGTAPEDLYIPFSILSPDPYDPSTIGRRFAWGIADPYNASHCDFVRLRDSVFTEWRVELRSAAREKWYEGWRTSRLKRTPQRIRQQGGVTPVAAVPREGRSASGGHGQRMGSGPGAYTSSPPKEGGLGVLGTPTPRAVSAGQTKADRVLGMGREKGEGLYRGVTAYQ